MILGAIAEIEGTYLQFNPPPRVEVIAAAPAVQNIHVMNKLRKHRQSQSVRLPPTKVKNREGLTRCHETTR
jgi:hypothetical protein